jgi:hypothetical protein
MKCEQYWPDNGSSRQYGPISVTAKAEHVYAEFVVRELHVVKVGSLWYSRLKESFQSLARMSTRRI